MTALRSDLAAIADMIREVVTDQRMPPWSANPEFGHFANDARLSDAQRAVLQAWATAK